MNIVLVFIIGIVIGIAISLLMSLKRIKQIFKDCIHQNISILWHKPDEIPQEHKSIIYKKKNGEISLNYIPSCLRSCKLTVESWEEFVEDRRIICWAFLRDLVP